MKAVVTKRARAIIQECLLTDGNYYKFLHPECGDLKKVVNYTNSLVKSGCTFYEVVSDGDRSMGYFIINKNGNQHTLIEFFLNSHLRLKEITKDFFELIESKLNNSYFCQIPSKNANAVRFLEKQGLKLKDKKSIGNQVFYLYQR